MTYNYQYSFLWLEVYIYYINKLIQVSVYNKKISLQKGYLKFFLNKTEHNVIFKIIINQNSKVRDERSSLYIVNEETVADILKM